MILNISHIAIAVRDMEAALRFYRDVLGLFVSADWVQELKASVSGEAITGGRDITRRCVWLRWTEAGGDAPGIALDEMMNSDAYDRRADLFDLGIHHMSFWVDDIDAIIDRARDLGFEITKPHTASTADYGEREGGSIRSVFLRDADRNLIQCDMRVA
ncbi:MAG: VOC family protein [Sphingobium sp.]